MFFLFIYRDAWGLILGNNEFSLNFPLLPCEQILTRKKNHRKYCFYCEITFYCTSYCDYGYITWHLAQFPLCSITVSPYFPYVTELLWAWTYRFLKYIIGAMTSQQPLFSSHWIYFRSPHSYQCSIRNYEQKSILYLSDLQNLKGSVQCFYPHPVLRILYSLLIKCSIFSGDSHIYQCTQ